MLAALVAGLATLPADAAASAEFKGHCQVHRGLLHRSLPWRVRSLDEGRVAVELVLPAGPGLPRAQYLAKDGEVLLHWTDPSSARPILDPDGAILKALAALPASTWLSLLTGEDLEACLAAPPESPSGGWWRREGQLGPWPAQLRSSGGLARSLRWLSPDGAIRLSWRRLPADRRVILKVRLAGGQGLRITYRPARSRPLTESDWLFLDESSIFLEPES